MIMANEPLVSVVTPVYNGEKYLSECIESVLSQTYKNWEYVIVNNCSYDNTLEIAESYSKRDPRIRIHNNREFLSVIRNWNIALRQISPASKYCKIVHADDWLFPDCIRKMVDIAEEHPTVNIVGSYALFGSEVRCVGLPYPSNMINGLEICRATLRDGLSVLGSPSMHLIRSELIREREFYYNEKILHADTEACLETLKNSNFGFVHQVLSYIRVHDDSISSTVAERLNTKTLESLGIFIKFGPEIFNDDEFTSLLKIKFNNYYRFLGRNFLLLRKNDFWKYHLAGLKEIGYPFEIKKLLFGLISEIIFMLFNLNNTVERIYKVIEKKRTR